MTTRGTPRNQVFLGTLVHCRSRTELEFIHDAAVAVGADGKILALEQGVGDGDAVQAKEKLLSGLGWHESDVDVHTAKPGQFFFPGFIDTHIHASQYPNAGLFGKTTLLEWLQTYTFPMEASLSDPRRAETVYRACIRRTLAHGTTTATYFASRDVATTTLLAQLCLAAGQRAFVGRVCMDNPDFCPDYYCDSSSTETIQAARDSVAAIQKLDPKGEIVTPIITPRFAPSCTPQVLKDLAALQKQTNLPVQTHISENTGEVDLVAGLFPQSSSYAGVYDDSGLLTPRTVLAHAVHLSEEEAALIARRGAKVAHCPCSNSSLTSGAARVRWMWNRGVEVGLGTDVSGGYSASVLEAARQAALVSRHVAMKPRGQAEGSQKNISSNGVGKGEGDETLTVEEVLYLSTRGGARCLGLEDRIGGFEVGKDWDAQLVGLKVVRDEDDDANGIGNSSVVEVDEGNVDVFGWDSWEEKLAKWLYNGDDRNTKAVWVKGRLVHSRR